MAKWKIQYDFNLTVVDELEVDADDSWDAEAFAKGKLVLPTYVRKLARRATNVMMRMDADELASLIEVGYAEEA
jgi:hypothetical protein